MLPEHFLSLKTSFEQLGPSEEFNSLVVIGGQGVSAGASINQPNVVIYDGNISSFTDLIHARLSA